MDLRDFVALTLLAAGGEVQGKTKLQKLLYFVGALTQHLDDLGYRPDFYGPYSDEIAYALGQLRAIGAVDRNETEWGSDGKGFEIRRDDFRLNDAGRKYAEGVAARDRDLFEKIRHAIDVYHRSGDLPYMDLSIAAKTYFFLGQKKSKTNLRELAGLAPRFGWSVSPEQVHQAATYLEKLGLVEVAQ